MKPLEISAEQKEKLLEMANKLFPEHIWGFENDDGDWGVIEKDLKKRDWNWRTDRFHWFEFCVLWLAPKLTDGKTYYIFIDKCNSSKHLSLKTKYNERYFAHPVDCLYEYYTEILPTLVQENKS